MAGGGGGEEEESCRHPTLFITEDVAVDGTTPNPEHLHFQPQLPSRSDRMRRKLEGEGQRWPSWGDTVLTKMCTPPISIGLHGMSQGSGLHSTHIGCYHTLAYLISYFIQCFVFCVLFQIGFHYAAPADL